MSDGTSIPVPLLSGGLTVLKLMMTKLFSRLAGGSGVKVYPLKLAIKYSNYLTP